MIFISIIFSIILAVVVVVFLAKKRNPTSSHREDSALHLEIKQDVKLVMEELKKLYEEKALLVSENNKLKHEIASLKKK